ncbi:rod shape-determining protein MreC, partial [Vibrio parahaemolyticus V-223/04]
WRRSRMWITILVKSLHQSKPNLWWSLIVYDTCC